MPNCDRNGSYLFTSESVSMGHPDKVADQVSDALLDSLIEHDPQVRFAVETLVTTNLVVVAGEVTTHNDAASEALSRTEQTVRETVRRIGYDDPDIQFDYKTCDVISRIHPQSADISQGVTVGQGLHSEQGAGDQGLMFGFACDETATSMPLPIHLAHRLVERLANVREAGGIEWLRPDAKSQVTVSYDSGKPVGLHTIVISTQHTEAVIDPKTNQLSDAAQQRIRTDVIEPVIQQQCPEFRSDDIIIHINPTDRKSVV